MVSETRDDPQVRAAVEPQARGHHLPQPRGSGWGRLQRGLTGGAVLAAGAAAWWWLATHHFGDVGHADVAPRASAAPAG
jgi:hypothetical protein